MCPSLAIVHDGRVIVMSYGCSYIMINDDVRRKANVITYVMYVVHIPGYFVERFTRSQFASMRLVSMQNANSNSAQSSFVLHVTRIPSNEFKYIIPAYACVPHRYRFFTCII